ncbi:MAG: HipA domain-containing protein [Desulfobacula sp.]|nr:HipA domain-containing protein [Desulfobacula sp.]
MKMGLFWVHIPISNLDDHLRNHGCLYDGPSGWRLSPLYDLEPMQEHVKARYLQTNINESDGTASLKLAYEVIDEFGIKISEARNIVKDVAKAVKDWDKDAIHFGAGKSEMDFMSSAFEHDHLKQALK